MAGEANLGTGEAVQLASPGARLGSRIIDLIIVGVASVIIAFVEPLLLPLLAAAAYEVVFITMKGQTPGKMATGIKVVRADNGGLVTWGASVGRWLIPTVAYVFAVIPGLLVHASLLWGDRRQGWHDKAVKTLVIKT